jgi:hypothetical protein
MPAVTCPKCGTLIAVTANKQIVYDGVGWIKSCSEGYLGSPLLCSHLRKDTDLASLIPETKPKKD